MKDILNQNGKPKDNESVGFLIFNPNDEKSYDPLISYMEDSFEELKDKDENESIQVLPLLPSKEYEKIGIILGYNTIYNKESKKYGGCLIIGSRFCFSLDDKYYFNTQFEFDQYSLELFNKFIYQKPKSLFTNDDENKRIWLDNLFYLEVSSSILIPNLISKIVKILSQKRSCYVSHK